ncbi:MAG: DUF2231 domain-containing protein [Bacteroidia bacterium]|nr:DUF2231 domain-containing protein [Bacteroidia bacterium]
MPVHPQTVHFPIALLYTAFGLYLWHATRPQDWVVRSANLLHILGILTMILAIFSGKQALPEIPSSPEISLLLNRHELMAYLAIWFFIGLWIWQYILRGKLGSAGKWIFIGLFALILAAMTYGSHLGGRMVYEFGVGVKG